MKRGSKVVLVRVQPNGYGWHAKRLLRLGHADDLSPLPQPMGDHIRPTDDGGAGARSLWTPCVPMQVLLRTVLPCAGGEREARGGGGASPPDGGARNGQQGVAARLRESETAPVEQGRRHSPPAADFFHSERKRPRRDCRHGLSESWRECELARDGDLWRREVADDEILLHLVHHHFIGLACF